MKSKTANFNENIAFLGILLLIIKTFLSINRYFEFEGLANTLVSLVIIAVFAVKIVLDKYSLKTLLIYAIIILLALITCFCMNSFQILVTVFACLAIRKVNFNKVIKFSFRCELISAFVLILISLGDFVFFNTPLFFLIKGVKRYHLGFYHPNSLSLMVFNLILMWLWLNYEKLKLYKVAILIAVETVSYFLTKTRTTFLIVLFITVLICIFRKCKSSRVLALVSAAIFPALSVAFLYLSKAYTYTSEAMVIIDKLLTGRLRLASYAYNTVGLTFFGSDVLPILKTVTWDEQYQLNAFTYDCLYSELLTYIGILLMIELAVLFVLLSRKKINKINIFLIAWCLYGITEVHGINCMLCFPIMLLVFLDDKKRISELPESLAAMKIKAKSPEPRFDFAKRKKPTE